MNSISRVCRKCGYDLRGLEPNPDCPECGTLNLFVKPYRGVEIFAFTAKSGLKTIAFLVLMFVGACVVVALGEATHERPSTQLPNEGLDTFDIPFMSVVAVGLFISYFYTRMLTRNNVLRMNWDKQTIATENCVHNRGWIPYKKKYAEYPMSQLRGYGYGSPFGIVVDLLRKGRYTSWTYIQLDTLRIYIHDNTEDHGLFEERVSSMLPGVGPSSMRDELANKTLPVWATVLVFLFIAISAVAIAYMIYQVFFVLT